MKASYQDEPLAAEKVQQHIHHMIPISRVLHLLLQKIILDAVRHVDQAHKLMPVFHTQQAFCRSDPVFCQIDQLSDRQSQPGLLKPGQDRGCLLAKRDAGVALHRAADTAGEYTVAGERRIIFLCFNQTHATEMLSLTGVRCHREVSGAVEPDGSLQFGQGKNFSTVIDQQQLFRGVRKNSTF
jgi:hypothetical protein